MFYDFIVPVMVHMVSYWVPVLCFYALDWLCLDDLDIRILKYSKAIKISLTNQLTITIPVFYLLKNFVIKSAIEASEDSIMLSVGKTFLIINLANLFFYCFHRLLHTKYLFNRVHYIHHEFIEPVGAATFYAHPIEHLFSNVLSFLIPVILIGVKYWILIGLLAFSTIISVIAHVEYEILPLFLTLLSNKISYVSTGSEHLVHHKYFTCNYGFAKYLDKLFGTYKKFTKI